MKILGYRAVEGSGLSDKQAAIYGEVLYTASPSTPEDIVRLATPPESPLHEYFEWDDSEAAQKYRKEQAAKLSRSIRIIHETVEGPKEVKLLISVQGPVGHNRQREYHTSVEVASSAELRARYIAELKQRLASLRRELSEFREFAEVVKAIDSLDSAA